MTFFILSLCGVGVYTVLAACGAVMASRIISDIQNTPLDAELRMPATTAQKTALKAGRYMAITP